MTYQCVWLLLAPCCMSYERVWPVLALQVCLALAGSVPRVVRVRSALAGSVLRVMRACDA
eukprot:8535833-Lingulodinium_polyedra.AAC.1